MSEDEISQVLQRAIDDDAVLNNLKLKYNQAKRFLRYRKAMRVKALNLLELAIQSSPNFKQGSQSPIVVTDDNVIAVAGASLVRYDKSGDGHYDLVSAMIKSVRGSDPDAALYWIARMLTRRRPCIWLRGGW